MTVEAALTELESLLPGMNYVVSLDLHRVPSIPEGTLKQHITAAIGPSAVIGGARVVALADMLAKVEWCLRWPGDSGSHPDKTAIQSPRLNELVACVLSHLQQTAVSSVIWKFWILSGHPHYPVQWHFAYLLAGPTGSEVFIGSSSD